MTDYMISKYQDTTSSYFVSAQVEINGVLKSFPLRKIRTNNRLRVLIDIPEGEAGIITRRVVKDAVGNIVWDDALGKKFYYTKPADSSVTLDIPIDHVWKGGVLSV